MPPYSAAQPLRLHIHTRAHIRRWIYSSRTIGLPSPSFPSTPTKSNPIGRCSIAQGRHIDRLYTTTFSQSSRQAVYCISTTKATITLKKQTYGASSRYIPFSSQLHCSAKYESCHQVDIRSELSERDPSGLC